MAFRHYYKSPQWKFKSKMMRNMHPYCSMCGSTENLISHHRSYANRGHENLEDLQVLCFNCHEKRHGRRHD